MVSPVETSQGDREQAFDGATELAAMFGYLTDVRGIEDDRALAMAARAFDLSTRSAAKLIKKHRYSVKRQSEPPS